MGVGLAQRGFSGGDVLACGIDGGFGGLKTGGGIVASLGAHDSLPGQGHGAAGVGLLVVVVGLGLGQRCLCRLKLGLGVASGAAGFAAVLALGLNGFANLEFLAGRSGLGGGARGLEVVAFDDGDELAGLHVLAFIHGQGLDAPWNPGAHHHLVGIHGADQLQVAAWADGDKVPDQRSDGEQPQNEKNPIACVHLCLTC